MKRHPIMTIVLVAVLLMLVYIARQDIDGTAAALAAPPQPTPTFSRPSQPTPAPAATVSPAAQTAPTPTPAPAPTASPQPAAQDSLEEKLLEGLRARDRVITINDATGDEIKAIFNDLLDVHPELFWLTGGADLLTTTTATGTYVEITPEMIGTLQEIEYKERELEAAVDELLNELPGWASDYEKILHLHDRIVNDAVYDEETLEAYHLYGDDAVSGRDAYNAYGALVDHVAVCAGYSRAYQLLLGRLDIPCGYVRGAGLDGESHAWNWVTLDGTSFYVDVTWDDPITENGENVCTHAYFGITEDELKRTHVIEEGQTLPECSSEEYDYYRCSGLYIDSNDPKRTADAIVDYADESFAEFKYGSEAQRAAAVEALLADGGLYDYPGTDSLGALHYSTDKNGLVLRITY